MDSDWMGSSRFGIIFYSKPLLLFLYKQVDFLDFCSHGQCVMLSDGCLRHHSSCRRRRAIILAVLFVLLGAYFLVIGPVRTLADRAAVLDHEAARTV